MAGGSSTGNTTIGGVETNEELVENLYIILTGEKKPQKQLLNDLEQMLIAVDISERQGREGGVVEL